ncbi:MAG: hypothetical protein KKA05_02885, partial [Alphaproteobacteria bacterium]|nr:hypothetical protein [Alphaproteobacteria bacterium]
MIRNIVRSLLLVFAAGAAGGLANALAVAGAGESGLLAFLKSDIAQDLTRQMIYMRMVWGGIWGAAFLLPDILRVWPVRNGILNGILLGLL